MRTLFFVFFIFCSIAVNAQKDSIAKENLNVYPDWTYFVPGATHFYNNRIIEGLIFSSVEIGGITFGTVYENKLKTESSTPYYNFPLLLGMQAYNVDKCDWVRSRLESLKYSHPNFKYDQIKFNDLLKAPFQSKNILTPITGGFILAAIVELYISGRGADKSYRDIDKIYFVNHYMDRNPALAMYTGVSLASSYGAGVAEEYYFRNGLMPILDYKLGQNKGLIYSSLFFGSMHFFNVLMSEKPDYISTLFQVAEATVAGYFLGRDIQKRDYNIGPAVSAHMWYDFTLMLGSFLVDPKNNFLGVNMKFKI
jgi:membrane protease YdiL (CAAX protease family)